jgi:hypothetical protein
MARLLLSHGRGEVGVEDVEAELAAFLDDQIARWFSVLDAPPHGDRGERARRLTALRVALAVFDGLPSYYATSAAELLSVHLATPFVRPPTRRRTASVPVPTGRPPVLTGEDDRTLVASTRLCRTRTTAAFDGVEVPAEVLRFADTRTPSALLRHMWTQRPALRRPLLAWLDELSCDKRAVVRTRAAQAAGLLCSVDFAQTFTELIEPAARSPLRRSAGPDEQDDEDDLAGEVWRHRREFAALALDHAARDPAVQAVVQRTLRRWRRDKNPALHSTAATALGYDVGQADLEVTLGELRVIGTADEAEDLVAMRPGPLRDDWGGLLFTAGTSVARLFATGGHRRVLRTLDEWLYDSRVSLRKLAVQAVVLMVGVPVSALGRPEQDDADDLVLRGDLDPGRDRWFALLALQDRHPEVVAPAADLVRGALRSPWRDVVAKVLTRWFELAASDDAALTAVELFLPRLVVEESDRARLRGLVRQRRRTWADPLPDDVADRLDDALAHASAAPPRERTAVT